jgi:hypothetical protein
VVLRELPTVKQVKGEHRRRWFNSESEDLIVWYADDGSIFGFQLCYDRLRSERALTWLPETGFSHDRIDDGEGVGLAHKRSPVLVPDGVFDARDVAIRFRAISGLLPGDVVEFVSAKLKEYVDLEANT